MGPADTYAEERGDGAAVLRAHFMTAGFPAFRRRRAPRGTGSGG
jgi:hypothetical protein